MCSLRVHSLDSLGLINQSDHGIMWPHTLCKRHNEHPGKAETGNNGGGGAGTGRKRGELIQKCRNNGKYFALRKTGAVDDLQRNAIIFSYYALSCLLLKLSLKSPVRVN